MAGIKVNEKEPLEVFMRRFKRTCEKAGTLAAIRRHEAYEKPTSVRKRKAAAARKRHLKQKQRTAPVPERHQLREYKRINRDDS